MHDIIVIGCGTAGMTAAIYARRNGKSVLILESATCGGQVAVTPKVENFPGFTEISGEDFANRLMEQADSLGAEFELEQALKIEKTGDRHFTVTTDFGKHESKAVILATGAKPRKIGIQNEDDLIGKGLSYCAVCDGAFFKDEDVALIGDANTALIYTQLLSGICRKVYLLTLFDRFFGEQDLVDSVLAKENVEVRHNLSLKEFVTNDRNLLSGIKLEDTQTKEPVEYKVSGCFISIGQVPDNKAFGDIVNLDAKGYIIAGEDCLTGTEGVFAAGDCRTKAIRQLTTAAADGAVAALGACRYIDKIIRPEV